MFATINPPLTLATSLLLSLSCLAAQTPLVTATAPNMRIKSSQVSGSGNSWAITLVMDDDNGNSKLPSSYRRWWHARIGRLSVGAATTLDIRVSNAGYSDRILPVWSQSRDGGQTFGPYTRMPTSALPRYASSTHRFTLVVPAGITDIRLAKYFPYTIADRDALLARVRNHIHLRAITNLGNTSQGRSLPMLELTDTSRADTGKRRVWIHAGIHPAETTSYFVVEGLVDWLLSGAPRAELALQRLIFNIVPMANPDGVHHGNYRTTARSVNLETQWRAPYNSSEREVVALRRRIEALMGTSSSPGSNPIELLLNLHSSHNVAYPFHFQHVANPNFSLGGNNSGVIPAVNAKEGAFIAAFRNRSAMVRLGSTASSTLGAPSRPFVESMMHDRWSIDAAWTGGTNKLEEVMAITFEGTYGLAADRSHWSTKTDYRQVGLEMGLAIADYFGATAGSSITAYGAQCGARMTGNFLASPDRLSLFAAGVANDPMWLVLGATRQSTGLPFSTCVQRTELSILLPSRFNALGFSILDFAIPTIPGFAFKSQVIGADLSAPSLRLYASNGLDVIYLR